VIASEDNDDAYLSFTERISPPTSSVHVASEIQDGDLPPYRGIYLDVFPGGRERIQPLNSDLIWGKVRTSVFGQRWELIGLEC